MFSQTAGDFYKRATVKFKAGDYAGAAVEYTRAIDLSQNSAVLYSNRGVFYFRIEQFDNALSDNDQAIALDPTIANAH